MILNPVQDQITNEAVDWYKYGYDQVFQIDGEAGTGKSVVLHSICRRLNLNYNRILPLAYTGQAAIVMRTKGFLNAKTLHSGTYEYIEVPLTDDFGRVIMNTQFNMPTMIEKFVPITALKDTDLIVVDEGFMIPKAMKKNLLNLGIKILVAGDQGQLPPIADEPAFLVDGEIRHLTQLMRQAEDSAIVYIAHRARKGLPIHCGYYSKGQDAVLVIEEKDLTKEMIQYANIVVCGKNKTRDEINNMVRRDILHTTTILPQFGERVICRKNNWKQTVGDISLANGLVGTVVKPPDVGTFGGKTFTMDFLPDLTNQPFQNLVCDYEYFTAKPDMRNVLKNNKYNSANKFEYAYASTTHLCQGAEYQQGIYIQEKLGGQDISSALNYTGITRFRNFLIYVVPSKKYW